MATRYDTGDIVATPDGPGVVTAVLTRDFEFPQGKDELNEVSASDDQPGYVVGLKDPGAAVYRASNLEAASLDEEDHPSTDGEAETAIVDESVDGLDDLPEGWDRESILEYWEEIGGEWEECVEGLTDEFSEDRAERLCSSMKDELLRTKRWRNRF